MYAADIPRPYLTRAVCILEGERGTYGKASLLMHLLPHQLVAERHAGALVAFLDFRKAYVSVSCKFLKHVMVAIGLGNKFVSWVM
jgi:hypothetical protein